MSEVLDLVSKNASLCQQGITACTGESWQVGRSTDRAHRHDGRRSPMSGEQGTCRWHLVSDDERNLGFERPVAEMTLDGDKPLAAHDFRLGGLHKPRSRPFDGPTGSISLDERGGRFLHYFSLVSGALPRRTNVENFKFGPPKRILVIKNSPSAGLHKPDFLSNY